MAYFFAGLLSSRVDLSAIQDSLGDVLPPALKEDVVCREEAGAFLINCGTNKAIPDRIIREPNTGSWLAVLGTPIIRLDRAEDRLLLLARFFRDPRTCLRVDLDGLFAILAFDAAKKRLLVATDANNTTAIFTASTDRGVFVSSHELVLARHLSTEIDPLGFALTIQMKYPWGTRSRFKGINKLLPSQVIEFGLDDPPRADFYWRPSEESVWQDDFDGIIDRWGGILRSSVLAFHRCSNNNAAICTLTGGEDARLLLAQCHALDIPFFAMVDGADEDVDVRISREAARDAGFELVIRPSVMISEEQLVENGTYISIMNDGYEDYFRSCRAFAIDAASDPMNRVHVKYCGVPGGEAYRGAYYLRGKVVLPSRKGSIDHRFFTRMKFLLDFHHGLLRLHDEVILGEVHSLVEAALSELEGFPRGTQIDHLVRTFQTCQNTGLIWKNPLYLPLATREMTRTVYNMPPRFKRGGKVTKAITERLWPELAWVRTQKGVPTVRRTVLRAPIFFPEYTAYIRAIAQGAVTRLFKWSDSNKPSYMWRENAPAIKTLLTKPPFVKWFSSPESMITGNLYEPDSLIKLLSEAKQGSSRFIPILGRIFNQEFALRWVRREP